MLLRSLLVVSLLSLVLVAQAQGPALTVIQTLEGHKELVYSVTFSPDGKHLVSGAFDKSVKLWDSATNKEVKTFAGPSGHTDLVLHTAISPDGRLIASAAKDNSIKLWDMPFSGAYRSFVGATSPVLSQALSPDGSKLVAGLEDGTIKAWNTGDGKEIASIKCGKGVKSLAISANGQYLAAGEASGQVNVYQMSDGKSLGALSAHTGEVRGLGFHPNNQLLYSAGADGQVKVWNVPPEANSTVATFEKTSALGACRAVDGRWAVACADKSIRILKADGTLEKTLPPASANLGHLALAGDTVLASLENGKLAWWDVKAGTFSHQVQIGAALQVIKVREQNPEIQIESPIKIVMGDSITNISLRSDGLEFAVGLSNGIIKIGEITKDKNKKVEQIIKKEIVSEPPVKIGGDAPSRLNRQKRWVIQLAYDNPQDFVARLANLQMTVGARMNDGRFLLFDPLPEKPPYESKSVNVDEFAKFMHKQQKIFFQNRKPADCENFATAVGMKEKPKSLFLLLSQSLEVEILKKEAEHHKMKEKEIVEKKLVTVFRVQREKDKWQVEVESSKIDPSLSDNNTRAVVREANPSVLSYHPTNPNLLAIFNVNGQLKTWLINENKLDKTIPLDATITDLAWHKDGNRLLAASDKQLILIDPKDGKILNKFTEGSTISSVVYGSDQNHAVATTLDNQVYLKELGSGRSLQNVNQPSLSASLIRDGKAILIITKENVVRQPVYLVRSFAASPTAITSFAVIDGGNRAVLANVDGLAKVINLSSGNVDKEFKGHAGAIQALAATSNSQLLFTAGVDKKLRCFNIADGKELKALPNDAQAQSLFATEKALLLGNSDGAVALLNITNTPNQPLPESFGKPLHTFKQPAAINSVLMASNTSIIYAASQDKSITSFKIASDGPLRNLGGHGNLVDAAIFSPDGLALASSSHDGTVRLWNVADGKQMGEVKLAAQPLYCLAWRPDGKQLAVGSFDRSIRLIDVASKKVEREIKGYDDKSSPNGHGDAVYAVVYAGNDKLYSAGADGKIKLWNVADGGQVKTFIDPALKDKAQRDFINSIRLTSDGKKLISVGNGGWLTIWETGDGKLLHSQKMPIGLYGLSIRNDNTLFATGNMNGTIYLIKMP